MTHLHIRPYREQDARALTDIFYDTIHHTGLAHYTHAQVNAWAPLPKEYHRWQQRLALWPPIVAELDGRAVGFITLTPSGHIEWTYTHRNYQRRGIASRLYRRLEEQARQLGITSLTVDASRFARPFFEKQGFAVVRENRTIRAGEKLQNWHMAKPLFEKGAS
ncbi:GNAT family N-acetyltransferase [Ferrimonas sediminicola]|uniref:GNAT family N-acetyltransferase n=1 Tax=Ferrimonas sediminicola TaxID=2569538 RepID=A0A4U1BDZ3_9GAMM|nr:GNAT family N-acetyltransferase [Ferrimonas sediminicola]TKB48539.1 GNAT family N-acetyltransferase [Ferrimonas sediminicola]